MYDVKMSSQKRKDDISLSLNRAILHCDSIPCPNKFLSDTSSRSVPGGDVSEQADMSPSHLAQLPSMYHLILWLRDSHLQFKQNVSQGIEKERERVKGVLR